MLVSVVFDLIENQKKHTIQPLHIQSTAVRRAAVNSKETNDRIKIMSDINSKIEAANKEVCVLSTTVLFVQKCMMLL